MTLSDGQVYHILIRGTSLAPRVYVTPLTAYGVIEAGWQKTDSILIQNASNVTETIDNVTVPYGYHLLSAHPSLPATLGPRDSLWLVVQFSPTGDSDYNAPFQVSVTSPCSNVYTGMLTGRGQSVKLQVPVSYMNYGLVKPCDCAEREIPLPNFSNLIPITIDTIWIDGVGVTTAVPSTFHWKRKSTGQQTLPFTIAPNTADTLVISFCPDIPATSANLKKSDSLHIRAHTPGWSTVFKTVLSGRREMNFQPNTTSVQFPATRVDTSAVPLGVSLYVPDITLNPDGDSIVISDVTFQPDQKVFSATASTGLPLPWIVKRNQSFTIKVHFYPRSPKLYTARMLIHTTFPCNSVDTTVLVMGSGFAPAFGLQMAFDTARVGHDTIRLTTCDTLTLGIQSSRDIPQRYIDAYYHLGFDTTELQAIGGSSPYSPNVQVRDTSDGAYVVLKDGVDVKAGIINWVKLKVIGGAKRFPITLDQIYFDSDSLVFFKIIAGLDHGIVEIDQPMITMTKLTDWDTVHLKDCKDETVIVRNPGVIPVRFDSIEGLPKWHKMTGANVPLPAMIAPGDSIRVTVQFCPRSEGHFDTAVAAVSNVPCLILDTGMVRGFGYAPPFPFKMVLGPSLVTVDSVRGRIADTVEVPVLIDRDIPLTPLDVRYTVSYDARALEYLKTISPYAKATVVDHTGSLEMTLAGCQNVAKGEIARLVFLVTVPDTVTTPMSLVPGVFTSDSIMFIKPRPVGDTTMVTVLPRCSISRLLFSKTSNRISPPRPNPAGVSAGPVGVDVSFVTDASPELVILNPLGERVQTLLDGRTTYTAGTYHVEFDASRLAAGTYHLLFRAGAYHATEKFVVIK